MADNKLRKRGIGEGALNAVNRSLISTAMLPTEVGAKLISGLPWANPYSFGSATDTVIGKAQNAGILSDKQLGGCWRVATSCREYGCNWRYWGRFRRTHA